MTVSFWETSDHVATIEIEAKCWQHLKNFHYICGLHEIIVHLHKDWKRMNSNIFWCNNLKTLWHNIDVINADDIWNYVIIWHIFRHRNQSRERERKLCIVLHNIQLLNCVCHIVIHLKVYDDDGTSWIWRTTWEDHWQTRAQSPSRITWMIPHIFCSIFVPKDCSTSISLL